MFRPKTRRKFGVEWRVIKTNSHLILQVDWKMIRPRMAKRLAYLILLLSIGPAVPAIAQNTNSPANATAGTVASNPTGYEVQGYVIEGRTVPPTNVLVNLFTKYSGPNVSLETIIQAASDLESEYVREGYPSMNIVIAPKKIRDGIVTMDVFPGALAQIVVAGNRYLYSTNGVAVAMNLPANGATPLETNTPPANTTTNAGPRFTVQKYQVLGNTLLSPQTLALALTNTAGAYGTNVTLDGIVSARSAVKNAYFVRGFVTVDVSVPPQKLTNEMVKLQVTEGRLSAIKVTGNYYYSSNNVMRALPSLHTNMILNGLVFQDEVNRANASQDRQIYPMLQPGPDPGTSDLILKIKDRLPLHAKIEYNNQSSPGTPLLRLNSSVVYNNLWDLEHSIGAQYSFSPGFYKGGNQWYPYDQPLIANYGAFYRMPLGNPPSIEEIIEAQPGTFGYSEATRKFTLPPPSGQPELNVFASRSTIDTGLQTLSRSTLYDVPGVISIVQDNVQQDITVNNDVGMRLSTPLTALDDYRSSLSGGLDFKTFQTTSLKTNNFLFTEITVNAQGQPNPPIITTVASPVPTTFRPIEYLPVALSYSASWHNPRNTISWGLGASANFWYSGTRSNLDGITGSKESTGHWLVLTPNFSWLYTLPSNWQTTLRADGQWASEPLISNEQFGAGGVNSVRGYREGDVFGDTGWHVSLEEQTPPHTVGIVYGKTALIIRGTVYMDYAHTYSQDPQGGSDGTALWGAGFGGVASIGPHWETRFLCSWPLLKTLNTESDVPFFNFSLTAQF